MKQNMLFQKKVPDHIFLIVDTSSQELTLRTDCVVCRGYVTVVATALATAPMMKTSAEESWTGSDKKKLKKN